MESGTWIVALKRRLVFPCFYTCIIELKKKKKINSSASISSKLICSVIS